MNAVTAQLPTAAGDHAPPLRWQLRSPRILQLQGPIVTRLAEPPLLRQTLGRLGSLQALQRLRFDLTARTLDFEFASGRAGSPDTLRSLAVALQENPWSKTAMLPERSFLLAQACAEEPLELYRHHSHFSNWKVEALSPRRFRIHCAVLRRSEILETLASALEWLPGLTVEAVSHRSGELGIATAGPVDSSLLLTALETCEHRLRKIPVTVKAGAVQVPAWPLHVYLLTALAGSFSGGALPILSWLNGTLLVALSAPGAARALQEWRIRRVGLDTLYTTIAAGSLATLQFLPSALMLWTLRLWQDLLHKTLQAGQRRLRRTLLQAIRPNNPPPQSFSVAIDRACKQARLSGTLAHRTVTSIEQPATPFRFANLAVIPTLLAGAASLARGGLPMALAVLRPDFLSPVLLSRRLRDLAIVLHLAREGILVRDVRSLESLARATCFVFDDSVSWRSHELAQGELSQWLRRERRGRVIYFSTGRKQDVLPVADMIGASKTLTNINILNRADFVAQQEYLGHHVVYFSAGAESPAALRASLSVAVGPVAWQPSYPEQIGILQPELGHVLKLLQLVRQGDREDRMVRKVTTGTNIGLMAAAIYLGLPSLAVVLASTAVSLGHFVFALMRLGRRELLLKETETVTGRATLLPALPP